MTMARHFVRRFIFICVLGFCSYLFINKRMINNHGDSSHYKARISSAIREKSFTKKRNLISYGNTETTKKHHMIPPNNIPNNEGKPGVILLWTTFFKNPKWSLKKLGRDPFISHKCLFNNCIVENNKAKYMESADILLFSCVDEVILPTVRHPNQMYAAYCWEPPCYVDMSRFKNLYANMTVTYRQDSDMVDWVKIFKDIESPKPGPYLPKSSFKLKQRTIVWAVSNCHPLSKRDIYVNELSKYVDVDIYGGCGKLKCPRMSPKCYEKFEKEYKFYLSFENSICNGYVTEKFFNPLNYEIVPIVLGGADYTKFAPPHSYINVEDFESPKKLADYLKYLSNNETEYNKYFQWKNYLKATDGEVWCDLCQAAMQRSYHKELSPAELLSWWNDGTCDNDLVRKLLGSENNSTSLQKQ